MASANSTLEKERGVTSNGQQSLPLEQTKQETNPVQGHGSSNWVAKLFIKEKIMWVQRITKLDRIRWSEIRFFRFITHFCCEHSCHGYEKARVYETWPGKNVFFFKGHFICGPDPRGVMVTTVSIVLASWVFCVYVGNDLSNHSSKLIVTFTIVLTIIVLVNLFMVSTRDPGIIPRQDHPHIEEIGSSGGIRRKRVVVNGVEIRIKFCRICKQFRLPRSCHCAMCDNCVEKFDHHCPWIGQCIGLRNYRYYLLFISSSLVLFIYICTLSCEKMKQKINTGTGVFKVLANAPEAIALIIFSFGAIWFLGGLIVFHAYLIMLNQTAYENYKRGGDTINPYDKGILNNIKEALFTKLPPSRVHFRAETAACQQTHNVIDVNECHVGGDMNKTSEPVKSVLK